MSKQIIFEVSIAGMSEQLYSKRIIIYKPFHTVSTSYSLVDCASRSISKVSDLIDVAISELEASDSTIRSYGMDECNYRTIYIKHRGCLLGLEEDKSITDLINALQEDTLILTYIYVAGGASLGNFGYRFVVHSDEYVHKDSPHPHVHVIKDNISVRYYLDTLERFEQDKPSRTHLRDERKIIKPFLRKNKARFLHYWNLAVQGFFPPEENEKGKQFYRES